jgi:hypothetical protein
MVVEAEYTGDGVSDLARNMHGPGTGVKIAERRMRIVE